MSTSGGERRSAAAIAGHLRDASTARAFLVDLDPSVRATALAALCRMGAATPGDIVGGLGDDDATVRRRVLALAVPFDSVSLLPFLRDEDDSVAEQAAWALGERSPAEPGSVTALAAAATGHRDPLVREAAVAALGSIGDPEGRVAVVAATADKPAVRRRAVLALAAFDGPDVDEALQRALGDRDWQTRQNAELLADPAPTVIGVDEGQGPQGISP